MMEPGSARELFKGRHFDREIILRPMLGFKRFETAAVTIRGIELAEKIKKRQFNLRRLTGKATTGPEIWAAVLAA